MAFNIEEFNAGDPVKVTYDKDELMGEIEFIDDTGKFVLILSEKWTN